MIIYNVCILPFSVRKYGPSTRMCGCSTAVFDQHGAFSTQYRSPSQSTASPFFQVEPNKSRIRKYKTHLLETDLYLIQFLGLEFHYCNASYSSPEIFPQFVCLTHWTSKLGKMVANSAAFPNRLQWWFKQQAENCNSLQIQSSAASFPHSIFLRKLKRMQQLTWLDFKNLHIKAN